MANTSLVLTITTPRGAGDVARLIKDPTLAREECRALQHYFDRLKGGLESASFVAQTSTSAPVRASGTLTLTYASISNNDTCVIGLTTLTCVTGTPSGGAQFKKVTDATTTAANLVACVNANTTLSKLVKATNVAGVVTITAHVAGAIGNFVALTGSTGIVAGATYLASGAGGVETAPTYAYSRGI